MHWRNVGIYLIAMGLALTIAVSVSFALDLKTPYPFIAGLVSSLILGSISTYFFPLFGREGDHG